MAKTGRFKRQGAGDVDFNMTPMIDVTFQLIIFFVIAGQMSSAELERNIKLHRPAGSQALKQGGERARNRVIVNVVSKVAVAARESIEVSPAMFGQAGYYKIVGEEIDPGQVADLLAQLRIHKQKAKADGQPEDKFTVEIRADHRVNYVQVEPVIAAAVEAEIPMMNITALTAVSE